MIPSSRQAKSALYAFRDGSFSMESATMPHAQPDISLFLHNAVNAAIHVWSAPRPLNAPAATMAPS